VTLVVRKLRASRVVRSARRGTVEIDRPRLEEVACECYKVMRCQYHQIFPLDKAKPHRLHSAKGAGSLQSPLTAAGVQLAGDRCFAFWRATSRDHRIQRVDNRRNSARFPLYLAAGRVLSNPPIIVAP
jgi:hypothetical protein